MIRLVKEDKKPNELSFTGKVIGITKVKSAEGMAIKLTLDNKIYLEVASIDDQYIFEKLSRIVEIDHKLKIRIDQE